MKNEYNCNYILFLGEETKMKKTKKYFIDVDGVIRNFSKSIRRYPGLEELSIDKWQRLPNDLWRDMDKRPKFYLHDCDAYEEVVKFIKEEIGIENCIFLTNQCRIPQREKWTIKFVQKIFGNVEILFTGNFQEKVDILLANPNRTLIDDYPFFHEKEGFEKIVDQILLMDRQWNINDQHYYKQVLKINELNDWEIEEN